MARHRRPAAHRPALAARSRRRSTLRWFVCQVATSAAVYGASAAAAFLTLAHLY